MLKAGVVRVILNALYTVRVNSRSIDLIDD
jgi:hypothetical protein